MPSGRKKLGPIGISCFLSLCFSFARVNGSQTHRVRGLVWNRDFKKSWRLNRRNKARLDLKFFVLDSRNPHPPFTHCSVSVVQDSVGTFLNLFIVPNDRIILTQNFHFRLLLFYCVLLNCGFPQPRILCELPRLVKDEVK